MFEGSFPLSLDAKGRLTIPSQWCGVLEEQGVRKLVLTRHFGDSLYCCRLRSYVSFPQMR